jgi:hypothetical protein
MPDLTVHTAWTCATNQNFTLEVPSSSGTDTHKVSWQPLEPEATTQYGPHCTCKGFQVRKTCRHIKEMESQRCGWNAELEPSVDSVYTALGNPRCPQCAGLVIAVEVAA